MSVERLDRLLELCCWRLSRLPWLPRLVGWTGLGLLWWEELGLLAGRRLEACSNTCRDKWWHDITMDQMKGGLMETPGLINLRSVTKVNYQTDPV